MFTPSKPIGRAKFLVGVTAINIAIFIAAFASLAFRPTGSAHIAVLIVVGALQAIWFNLHSRRFADAAKGRFWPMIAFLICFGSFAAGYLIMAALWSSPEIQQEAFRTGGGLIGSAPSVHIETNAMVIEAGRAFLGLMGKTGAVILSGTIVSGLALVAFLSFIFSCVALALPKQMRS